MTSKNPSVNISIRTLGPALTPPDASLYRGEIFIRPGDDGTDVEWVPLTELARAWSLDYRALRDFVRDRTSILAEKCTVRHVRVAGQTTVHIFIRVADLADLHRQLQSEAGPRA